MKTKIFAALLGIASFVGSTSFARAEIPAGYVLVPADLFFGENAEIATTTPAAEISTTQSSVRVNDEIGYVGESYSLATVTVRDDANRAISGVAVNLISSRATDSVEKLSATTNANGEIIFRIGATEEGVSALTAIVDGATILERPRIVFLETAGGVGGNLLRAEILAEDSAEFLNQVATDFPDSVDVDTPTDIAISVENADGELVEDFTGTVKFESSDALAILPAEYTFVALDRGAHTFANAVTFATAGEQTLRISSDELGAAEISVEVTDAASTEVATPVITNPADGALLNTVALAGLAPTNANLAVFVDGEFFKNIESDSAGEFADEIILVDGAHEITVGVLRGDGTIGATSESIAVELDQTVPRVENLALDPGNRVVVGETVGVEVRSEPNLESATLQIGDESVELAETAEPGTYSGEFTAPAAGTYFAELELADAAGNIGKDPEAAAIRVEPAITIAEVETTPHDARVDLRWNAPTNFAEVANYEIFYGMDAENLNFKFTTTDNSTAWFIDELTNGVEYFFQIISLDSAGKQNGGSEIVRATPAAAVATTNCNSRVILKWTANDPAVANFRLDYGVASGEYVESRLLPDGAARDEWEVRDLVNGAEYFFALRGVDDFGETIAAFDEVSATPNANAVCDSSDPIELFQRVNENGDPILFWNAVAGATSYRIHAGTAPNIFDLPTIEVAATSFRPTGLAAGKNYYFAVSAVFAGMHETATLSNVTRVEVGPAEIILIALLAGLGGAFAIRRIKRASRRF